MTEQRVSIEDFQAEVGAFLEAKAARKQQAAERGFEWDEGDDSVAMFEEVDPDTAKDAYLRAIHRGDVVACQLFPEPGAGSDLAKT